MSANPMAGIWPIFFEKMKISRVAIRNKAGTRRKKAVLNVESMF